MTALNPRGGSVRVGANYVRAPGLAGSVAELAPATKARTRSSPARAALEAALDRQDIERRTPIVLTARRVARGKAAPSLHGPEIELQVPGTSRDQGQVLLQTDEHGVVNWIYPQPMTRARRSTPRARTKAARNLRTYVIPPTYPAVTKGPAGIVSKLLEVFVFPRLAPLTGRVADHFAAAWEKTNRPYHLRRFAPDTYTQPARDELSAADHASLSRGRVLLFVHGTFARAHSAFASVPPDVMTELDHRYAGRVFAFDHFTITEDPLRNAQRFVDSLPQGAAVELDIVCHSRGGLVGRALAEQQAALELAGRRLTVHKVVFAGSPNAGCVLADAAAMSHWIDRYTNWAAWVPAPGVVDVFEGVLSVVKQLAVGVMGGLAGLQSMVPHGAYLKKLNAGAGGSAQYFAMASNYEPRSASLSSFAHNTLMDAIFREDNDLVVPSDSVWDANGVASFPIAARHVFTPNDAVDHGGYFAHPLGRGKMLSWLTGA